MNQTKSHNVYRPAFLTELSPLAALDVVHVVTVLALVGGVGVVEGESVAAGL